MKEYCIRHIDGSPVKSDAERERVIQCLEAAIERRVSEVRNTQLIIQGSRLYHNHSLTHKHVLVCA